MLIFFSLMFPLSMTMMGNWFEIHLTTLEVVSLTVKKKFNSIHSSRVSKTVTNNQTYSIGLSLRVRASVECISAHVGKDIIILFSREPYRVRLVLNENFFTSERHHANRFFFSSGMRFSVYEERIKPMIIMMITLIWWCWCCLLS